jgi:hypothetical protein
MRVLTSNGKDYKLPFPISAFQQEMYVHLIDWKWSHITLEPGTNGGIEYDAILPERCADEFPMIYPNIVAELRQHQVRFPFRTHKYFNHMASSQAANINLFLPVLLHPGVDAILGALNPDFARLATSHLDKGYRIEFWDEPYGNLGDKTHLSGTDADIAIAYFNRKDELCLWLIEHKLTEKEFTTCGGAKSPGRQARHDCGRSFSDLLNDPSPCYYHDACKFRYWDITRDNQDFFPNHAGRAHCPFRGGMNQLWRNQLLALSVEQDARQPYKHASFSVVRHARNTALDRTLRDYAKSIAHNPKFSVFTSADVLRAAEQFGDAALRGWADWCRGLYNP